MAVFPSATRSACCAAALALLPALAAAQSAAPSSSSASPAAEPVIQPQVERRAVKPPRVPSGDLVLGLYAGTYATQNFGASGVSGLRLSYHITEDFFVDATAGRSRVSDEAFRQVLPGGVFVNRRETLSYYALSVGYNLLPGEVFFGRKHARLSQGYIVLGAGSTDFAGQKRQTFHGGFGLRVVMNDWIALQADVRNHVFSLDLLGRRETTQNLEVTGGLSVIF